MGIFWCEKDDHLWDDPDDLEDTFCLVCTLEPKQAKEIARIEAANQSLRSKAYSPHLDDEGDPILWSALEADCDMIRMTLEDEIKQLREDCKPFMAQIAQAKTYKEVPNARPESGS